MVPLLIGFFPGSPPAGICAHIGHVRNVAGRQPCNYLLVISFVIQQFIVDVDIRIVLFKCFDDTLPAHTFLVRVVAVGHYVDNNLFRFFFSGRFFFLTAAETDTN